MTEEELIEKIKEIDPTWKPMKERSFEEQEAFYDRIFDWEEDE